MTDRGPLLAALAAGAPSRQPTVRVLAAFAANAACNLAALAFAAGVDLDQLLAGTAYAVPFGQSPFAFARGINFERFLREGGYGSLFELLRGQFGFATTDVRVANLRDGYPPNRRGLIARAHAARGLLGAMLRSDPRAPNLVDGAVLATTVGGIRAFFEADAVAARARGPIRIGEVKSFPVVDGQAEPDKLGAALDQAAIYILLIKQLAEDLGHDPDLISTEAMLITPRNVGLRPTLSTKEVASRMSRIQRLLARVPSAADVAALVPPGASFGAIADQRPSRVRRSGAPDPDAGRRTDRLHALADDVGTSFGPGCTSCGAYRFCRTRAVATGSPQIAGPLVARLLPGVHSLDRAVDLAAGAPAGRAEAPAAAQLARAARLYDRHTPAPRAAAGGRPRATSRRHWPREPTAMDAPNAPLSSAIGGCSPNRWQ